MIDRRKDQTCNILFHPKTIQNKYMKKLIILIVVWSSWSVLFESTEQAFSDFPAILYHVNFCSKDFAWLMKNIACWKARNVKMNIDANEEQGKNVSVNLHSNNVHEFLFTNNGIYLIYVIILNLDFLQQICINQYINPI